MSTQIHGKAPSHENDRCDPLWRPPEWRIDASNFLARVSVRSRGDSCSGDYRVVNDAGQGTFLMDDA